MQVRRLCADRSLEATQTLIDLMHEDVDDRVRYMAAIAVLERGVGKPRDHSAEESAMARVDLSRISESDQELLVRLLKRVMGMPEEKPGAVIEEGPDATRSRHADFYLARHESSDC
jgi:hypothetical protein